MMVEAMERSSLQLSLWDLVQQSGPLPRAVMAILLIFSLLSWAVIFSKWAVFRRVRSANRVFLRAFRKAANLEAVAMASEQFRRSPLVTVFDFGYTEVARQMKSRGSVTNPVALERTLQLGMSEELTRLERNMSLLATTATVSPFIGLFGTVWGIIDAFQQLSTAGRGQPARCSAGNFRSPDYDCFGSGGRHSRRYFLQYVRDRHQGIWRAHGRLHAGVHEHAG